MLTGDPLPTPALLLATRLLCQKINTFPENGSVLFLLISYSPQGDKTAASPGPGADPAGSPAGGEGAAPEEGREPRPRELRTHSPRPALARSSSLLFGPVFWGWLWVTFSLRLSLLCQFLFKGPLGYKTAIVCPRSQSTKSCCSCILSTTTMKLENTLRFEIA